MDTRKAEILHVRCSAAEKERWREFAESRNAPLAAYVRALLNALVEQAKAAA